MSNTSLHVRNRSQVALPRVLLIDGEPRNGFITGTVKSFSDKGARYAIGFDPRTGQTGCTCPAFRFGKGKPCKHLKTFGGNLVREAVK